MSRMVKVVLALVLFATASFAQQPNLQGIWKADVRAAADVEPFVDGGQIPYQPAVAKPQTPDPLDNCFLPGVPRTIYMDYPFHIFQTNQHVAMTFAWSQVHRLIYTDGKPPLHDGLEFWMGDSRGRWEGNTLVVQVTANNDKPWFDKAGNFHSEAMKAVERYTLTDADTIQYEVTIEDPKVFTKPWTIRLPLHRQKNMNRIIEYQCQAEAEEKSGAFERSDRTWYPPAPGVAVPAPLAAAPKLADPPVGRNLRRTADGKPDLTGYYQPDGGGANYGL